ncbi:MAG: ABC transporter substrate-binding protein [Arenicellales bacterium]|nr:ABC transporter substrate-binding protein [Arenicellales bacterium]
MSRISHLYNIPKFLSKLTLFSAIYLCSGFDGQAAWNDPYPPDEIGTNILYLSFSERPKHLDPARAYSSDEYSFLGQIYEPPLQYHFLRRPYTLVPLTTNGTPIIRYLDEDERELNSDTSVERIAFTVYEFSIKPGIEFQPHPALAKDDSGAYRYHSLDVDEINNVHSLRDFRYTGTRELTAEDYVYQIKRLADPKRHSPIAGVMAQYIVGFSELIDALERVHTGNTKGSFVDLREYPLKGVETTDRYTYRIKIKNKYPQFLYWQAMLFFAPMPWEAEKFYSQSGLQKRNITLDWYPIGTGPFFLTENNPNLRMVLTRNPNFRGETYPQYGEPEDKQSGLLKDAGKTLPFIDRAVYSLEKESIPRWNKFLQGYYDNSGITSDSFDQAVQFNSQGDARLTEAMQERGIKLSTAIQTSIYYMGFNMLDEVIGGNSEKSRKLRQAISIAMDFEEFISIFTNGRGLPAQGPIPPGIFGAHRDAMGINPYVYDWVDGKARRKPIEVAHQLMRDAGYESGVDKESGEPLSLHFEAVARGPDDKARLNWIRKQFDKLGIQLIVRATDYNRFREKMLKGTGEIFFWGWNADYPDPENFLFLLYGPNSKAIHNGENASNYQSSEFDDLFEQMKNMENTPLRQSLIDRMVEIARRDAPWIWGFHPMSFSLHHSWFHNVKPNLMANNLLKYHRIDPVQRQSLRASWNDPVWWPLALFGGLVGLSILPAIVSFRRRERKAAL